MRSASAASPDRSTTKAASPPESVAPAAMFAAVRMGDADAVLQTWSSWAPGAWSERSGHLRVCGWIAAFPEAADRGEAVEVRLPSRRSGGSRESASIHAVGSDSNGSGPARGDARTSSCGSAIASAKAPAPRRRCRAAVQPKSTSPFEAAIDRGEIRQRVDAAEIAFASPGSRSRISSVGSPAASTLLAARCSRRVSGMRKPRPSATTAATPRHRTACSIAHARASASPPGGSRHHEASSNRRSNACSSRRCERDELSSSFANSEADHGRGPPRSNARGCGKTHRPIQRMRGEAASSRRGSLRRSSSCQSRWMTAPSDGPIGDRRGRMRTPSADRRGSSSAMRSIVSSARSAWPAWSAWAA